MKISNKLRRLRARGRGFSHVSMTLEAAAVMGWFAVCVIGEKYLADGAHARRDAETSAQQSSIASATSYCEGGGAAGAASSASGDLSKVTSSLSTFQNGSFSISSIVSIVMGLGLGGQSTFSLYSDPFQGAGAKASESTTGGGPHTFRADRSLACLERSKDTPASPEMSLSQYRMSIFGTNVQGY